MLSMIFLVVKKLQENTLKPCLLLRVEMQKGFNLALENSGLAPPRIKLDNALNELENSSNIKVLEVGYFNQDLISAAQPGVPDKVNTQSLPLRAYFDQTLMPVLLEGLKLVAYER